MLKNIFIGLLAVAAVVLGLLFIGSLANPVCPVAVSGFTDELNPKVFQATVTIGKSGTAINQYKCATADFNPGSVSSSTAADTKAIDIGAAALGSPVVASLSSVTSTGSWFATAKVTAASATHATGTLYLKGLDGAAVDLSTTTAKICVIY